MNGGDDAVNGSLDMGGPRSKDNGLARLATKYLETFTRNCPNANLSVNDRMELWRLFHLAIQKKTEL